MVPEPYLSEIYKILREVEACPANVAISIVTDVERICMLHDHLGAQAFPNRFSELLSVLKKQADSYGQPQNRPALAQTVRSMLAVLDTKLLIDAIERDTAETVEFTPKFNVSSDDRKRMLTLCQQIRDIINSSEALDDGWRRRLLKRISAVELEISKEKGNFDVILAGLAESGEALGKFGKDVKPLVDRVREIAGIAWPSSQEHQELPPPDAPKQLPKPRGGSDFE